MNAAQPVTQCKTLFLYLFLSLFSLSASLVVFGSPYWRAFCVQTNRLRLSHKNTLDSIQWIVIAMILIIGQLKLKLNEEKG